MRPHQIFAGVLALAAMNGIFSPYLAVVLAFVPVWAPAWLPNDPSLLFYLASLIVATTTLLLSGVPAALVENAFPAPRATGSNASMPNASMYVWLAAALLLSLPGALRFFSLFAG